jgi:hypothetical protein
MKGYGTMISKEQGDFDESLGLARGFIATPHEHDWSLVVQSGALIEAALTRALVAHFRADAALEDHLAELNVHAKMKLARAAALVDKPLAACVGKLMEIRNAFVHDIRMVKTSLQQYVETLDPDRRQSLLSTFLVPGDEAARSQLLKENPKQAFIWSANAVLEKLVGPRP